MVIYLSEPEVLVELVDGLKKAAGCCHALAHYQERPSWLVIRDKLEVMVIACQELASSKSMPRQDVLSALEDRKTKLITNGT